MGVSGYSFPPFTLYMLHEQTGMLWQGWRVRRWCSTCLKGVSTVPSLIETIPIGTREFERRETRMERDEKEMKIFLKYQAIKRPKRHGVPANGRQLALPYGMIYRANIKMKRGEEPNCRVYVSAGLVWRGISVKLAYPMSQWTASFSAYSMYTRVTLKLLTPPPHPQRKRKISSST